VSDSKQSRTDSVADIRRGALRLSRRLRVERAPGALSTTKISVLSQVHRHGPVTPGEVARLESQRPQSLTRVFAELEKEGLIDRAQAEGDRRRASLTITREGLRVLGADMAERDAWLAEAIGHLTDTEVEVLRLAGRLMDQIADS
jgi:DNA-binding MarR family transcriptional regulator